MKKIDWKPIWKEYSDWHGLGMYKTFSKGGYEWQKKIQSLVEAQLKPKRRKK